MLEPGDISVDYFKHDPMPNPGSEPPDSLKGIPMFLGKYDDVPQINVGHFHSDVIEVKGERDITILFQERDSSDTKKWHNLKTFTLGDGDAGFELSFKGTCSGCSIL
ncbi:uncharacterized protein [Apostichopus japonicus]|uniref:uncharacterized protein isoform X2 n=1 Tax=Stichopus japonicus TaxID=307972 RepID=UPI003AB5B2FE